MSTPKEALPALPERYRHMFCTKCGYTNPQTSAPAGKQGALCENVHCGYMAFVTEREFTADQMHAFREAGLSELRAEVERLKGDAERYRWLCENSFTKEGVTQFHVWKHSWEPHSETGRPTEWVQRVRGPALDRFIDAARTGAAGEVGNE